RRLRGSRAAGPEVHPGMVPPYGPLDPGANASGGVRAERSLLRGVLDMPRGSTRPAHRFHTAALQLSSLAVSQALCLLLGFATHALLARSIARADYGLFSSAYSWVTLLAPYAVFGVGEWWLLEFGRRGAAARDTLRPAIALVAATTLASVAVAIVWMPAAAA